MIVTTHIQLIFRSDTLCKSLLANMVFIPLLLIFNPFISLWLDYHYFLSLAIVYLFVFDMYVFFLTNPRGDFVFAKRLFDLDERIALLGLLLNAFLSLILLQFFDIIGLLIGTAISQIAIWTGRSYIRCRRAPASLHSSR